MIRIKSIKIINHLEWNNFYIFYKDYYFIKNNTKFEYKLNDFLELFKKINRNKSVENYIFWNNIEVIGRIELTIFEQIETVSLQINFATNNKVMLFEKCITEFICQLKKRFKFLRLESNNLELISIFEKLNFKQINTLLDLRLDKNIFENLAIKNQRNVKYQLEIKDKLSNAEIVELSMLYNDCFKEMIKNESYNYSNSIVGFKEFIESIDEYDKKIVLSIIKNEHYEIIGFSSVICSTKKLPIAEHLFSGIRKDYRGQKLSLLIKYKLYRYLFENEKYIKTIRTECYEVNTPILKSNYALGFEIYNKNHELYYHR